MRKTSFLPALAALAVLACTKPEEEAALPVEPAEPAPAGAVTLSAVLSEAVTSSKASVDAETGTFTWSGTDAVAVWSTGGTFTTFTLADGVGTAQARFSGTLTAGTPDQVAVYPASVAMDLSGHTLSLTLPSSIAWSEDITPTLAAVFSDGGAAPLAFKYLGGLLRVAVDNVPVGSASLELSAAGKQLAGDFTVDLSAARPEIKGDGTAAPLSITFDAVTEPGLSRVFCFPVPTGTYDDFSVTFKDADGVALPGMAVRARKVTNQVGRATLLTMPAVDLGIRLVWAYGSLSGDEALTQISGTVPAVDGAGNVYVTTNGSHLLTKISSTGTKLWSGTIGSGTTQNTSPSVDADDATVYAEVGNGTGTAVKAFASDGTEKWNFPYTSFFATSTPSPNFNQMAAAVGDQCIYVGNAGTTGSVLSINKSTGKRIAYVANAAGTAGPAGGVTSGMALTRGGVVSWHCVWGMYGANQGYLDAPSQEGDYGEYVPYGVAYRYGWAWSTANSGVAVSSIDGQDYLWSVGEEKTTDGAYNLHVICAPAAAGLGTSGSGVSQAWNFDHKITNVAHQDQGGICIGPRGEGIIALKNNGGDGGIYAVSTDGQKAYQYKIGADVAGAPAVDAAGNIHFLGDNGYYYIVRPDYATGTCTLLAKASLYTLAGSRGKDLGTATAARAWTSPMIGPDGKLYIGATLHKSWSDRYGCVLCAVYPGCTGPGDTPWPMKYADARHTCRQK